MRLEDVGEFVAWLQLPPAGRSGAVAVLPSAAAQVGAATVNRKLAAVSAFYAHQARNGAEVGDLLAAWKTGGRGGWKPFLHHVSKGRPYRGRAITLKAPEKLPRILTVAETQAILDACTRLRDRFFFACCTRQAAGQGRRWACAMRTSPPPSGRSASWRGRTRTVPAPSPAAGRSRSAAELIRLYADYLHLEYGDVDSDYVFINIWAEPRGQAWSYPAVYDLVIRLRARTGLDFDPHWFRHSAATRWLRDGVPVEVVSKLLGHSSVTMTSAVYGHLTAQDARAALEKAGWLTGREVTW